MLFFLLNSRDSAFGPAYLSSQSSLVLQEVMALQFDVIKKATRNFKSDLLLGEGRSGPVYKGIINDHPLTGVKLEPGIVVAVKNLSCIQVGGPKECLVSFFVSFVR